MKKIILVLSVISTLALAGCSLSETQVNNDLQESVNNEQQEIENNNQNSETNQSSDTVQELIEVAYNEKSGESSIRLPRINLISDDAKKVNLEIDNLAKELKNMIIEYKGDYVDSIDYNYILTDNILSIYMWRTNNVAGGMRYYTYNFEPKTGKLLTNAEILGTDKANKFAAELPEICDKVFIDIRCEVFGTSGINEVRDYNKTLVPKNIEDIPLYIDAEKGPQIVLKIASLAGSDFTYELVNLNDYLNDETESKNDFNINSYNGEWTTKEDSNKNFEKDGGRRLNIKVKDTSTIDLEYTVLQAAPANRIAVINVENIELLNSRSGSFEWDDDGWGNKGNGIIELHSDKIIMYIANVQVSEHAMWGIFNGEVVFTEKVN